MARRRINLCCDVTYPGMTVFNSRYWKSRMVYILRADRPTKYKLGRSRVVYIGETGKGIRRPSGSASRIAREAFGKLRGAKKLDVHPITFRGRQRLSTREVLERDLLAMFYEKYGELPRYNSQGKHNHIDNITHFTKGRLTSILTGLA